MTADVSVHLRKVEPEDIDFIYALYNDEDVKHFDLTMQGGVAKHLLVQNFQALFSCEGKACFTIVSGGEKCGLASLSKDPHAPNGYLLSLGLLKEYCGRGIGGRVVRELLEFSFLKCAAERVGITVKDYNLRSIHCFEKAGFVREGVARHACFHDGEYHDVLLFSILRDEYFKNRAS